jgi:hypothetical protein
MPTKNARMFIFHLEYFSSCKNFCNIDEKKYFFNFFNILKMKNIFPLNIQMETPFSECLVLLKNRVTFQLLIYFILERKNTRTSLNVLERSKNTSCERTVLYITIKS